MKRGTNFTIKVKDGEGRDYWCMDLHQLLMQAAMYGNGPVFRTASNFVVEVLEGEEVRERAGFALYWDRRG